MYERGFDDLSGRREPPALQLVLDEFLKLPFAQNDLHIAVSSLDPDHTRFCPRRRVATPATAAMASTPTVGSGTGTSTKPVTTPLKSPRPVMMPVSLMPKAALDVPPTRSHPLPAGIRSCSR